MKEKRFCIRCGVEEGEGWGKCESFCWGKHLYFGINHRYRPLTEKEKIEADKDFDEMRRDN